MVAAVIPMKHLSQAKQRLQNVFTQEQREALCLSMLSHMLKVLTGSAPVRKVFVITPDEKCRQYIEGNFPACQVVFDENNLSLNESAKAAAALLTRQGFTSMLFILGDLPLLAAQDVESIIEKGQARSVVLAPDRHGAGTNAVFLTPPAVMDTFFGSGSLPAHQREIRRRGLSCDVVLSEGFGCDVDTVEDLNHIHTIKNNSLEEFKCQKQISG